MRARFSKTLLLASALVATASLAYAQSPKDPKARTLFDQGKDHLKANRAKEACDVLEESLAIETAINTHYQLGKCYEALGRFATAHAAYLRAATMARTAGDNERFDAAQQAADVIKAKLATAVVVVPVEGRAPGLSITRDGQAIPESDWGKALPLDPGEHVFAAQAPGYESFQKTVAAQKTGGVTQVEVPVLKSLGTAPPPDATGSEEGWERRSGALFGLGIAAICVGGVALLGGAAGAGVTADGRGSAGPFIGVAVGGVLLLGAGIPITIIFGARVPPEPAAGAPAEGTPSTEAEPTATEQSESNQAAWMLTPMVSPLSGGLRLDF